MKNESRHIPVAAVPVTKGVIRPPVAPYASLNSHFLSLAHERSISNIFSITRNILRTNEINSWLISTIHELDFRIN